MYNTARTARNQICIERVWTQNETPTDVLHPIVISVYTFINREIFLISHFLSFPCILPFEHQPQTDNRTWNDSAGLFIRKLEINTPSSFQSTRRTYTEIIINNKFRFVCWRQRPIYWYIPCCHTLTLSDSLLILKSSFENDPFPSCCHLLPHRIIPQ